MAAVDFSDYFWGEKNDGFNVLYQNMKCGITAAKELCEFLRERAKLEEENSKAQAKLSKQLTSSPATAGTFYPLTLAFKASAEKLSGIHNQWSNKLTDLVREVAKYTEEQHKKHKQVKEDESATLETVKSFQETTLALQKAKEVYKQRCAEVEKLRRDNANTKDVDKAELKFHRSKEDYRSLVDKYRVERDDFERKMTLAAKRFQDVESGHLRQMRDFVEAYCQIVDNNTNMLGRVYQEFQIQLTDLTVENLLEQFTLAKHTGLEKPGCVDLDEEKVSLASMTGPASDVSAGSANSSVDNSTRPVGPNSSSAGDGYANTDSSSDKNGVGRPASVSIVAENNVVDGEKNGDDDNNNIDIVAGNVSPHTTSRTWTVPGFLRRNKRKEKGKKKGSTVGKDDDGSESLKDIGSDGEDVRKSQTPTPEVDDEGYSKQPERSQPPSNHDPWGDFNQSKTFDSSSDESDDDDRHRRKIKVEIKPVNNNGAISASVDELAAVVHGLELPPPPISAPKESRTDLDRPGIRRSHSQTQLNKDLLGLTLHPMEPIDPVPATESPSSGEKVAKIVGGADDVSTGLDTSNNFLNFGDTSVASNTSKEVQDIFGDFNAGPALPAKQNSTAGLGRPSSVQREKISSSLIALPRPPSRMGPNLRPRTSPGPASAASAAAAGESAVQLPTKKSSCDSPVSRKASNNGDAEAFKPNASFGLSRGPSPLTLGLFDSVPLAVAFQEVCHACFNGADESSCQVRLIGDMMVSFPAGIVQAVANNPNPSPLAFRVRNATVFESVVPNVELISPTSDFPAADGDDGKVFEFKMAALKELLRVQAEQNPNAAYFNIDLLKYQIKPKPGAGSCPLQMVTYWKCGESYTDLRLDYKYNAHAMAKPSPVLNVSIAVPVDGGVVSMQSQPTGTWLKDSNRALWKFNELSASTDGSPGGVGSLRGRFQLSNGPGNQATVAAQFNCEGTTLSGADFELLTPGYRLSLTKKRFVSGKYMCNGNVMPAPSRYSVPPEPERVVEPIQNQGPTEC